MNISLNFVVKLSFGFTKSLIGWLRTSPKSSGILTSNGTAGTEFEGFQLRMSSSGKPPIPRAFFISSDQSLGLESETLYQKPGPAMKFMSAVTCLLSILVACATNLLSSALGNLDLKFLRFFFFFCFWAGLNPFQQVFHFLSLEKTMVVLTFLLYSNDETIWFDEPIEKFEFIWLISCSFYNSWYNLKERGEIGIFDDKNVGSVKRIYPGNYSLDTLEKKMKEIFDKEGIKVKLNDHEKGSIVIENPLGRKIIFDRDLSYICDLIDSSQDKNFEKNNIPKAQRRYTLKKRRFCHQSFGFIQQPLYQLRSCG